MKTDGEKERKWEERQGKISEGRSIQILILSEKKQHHNVKILHYKYYQQKSTLVTKTKVLIMQQKDTSEWYVITYYIVWSFLLMY